MCLETLYTDTLQAIFANLVPMQYGWLLVPSINGQCTFLHRLFKPITQNSTAKACQRRNRGGLKGVSELYFTAEK